MIQTPVKTEGIVGATEVETALAVDAGRGGQEVCVRQVSYRLPSLFCLVLLFVTVFTCADCFAMCT